MKSPDNTEMDRLLRRHARLGGETLRTARDAGGGAAEATGAGAHLDADELNAYAEGALPEAVRPRYFAHLADCDTCRKLVTELALAASVAVEGKARTLAAESSVSKSWREWLAAIFSPSVLRYAVPALALFAVVIVAFVALRSQRDSTSVAQRGQETRYSAPSTAADSNQTTENTATTTGTIENHPDSNTTVLTDQQSQTQPGMTAAPDSSKTARKQEDALPPPQATPAPPTVEQADVSKESPLAAGQAGERTRDEVAAAAPQPAPKAPVLSAPAANEPGDRERQEEQKKAKAGKDDDTNFILDGRDAASGTFANKAEADEKRNDVGRATASRTVQNLPRNRTAIARRSAPAGAATEKEASSETRSVGGRRFRRDGGAWVDTDYNPSRPTINVRRGSEQYRSLVADEPGLRTIAEHLSGEVFVVWKSRAYRFY